MKIPKQILFSLLVLPFMLKTCEIGPETHGCNLPGEYRIKLTKAVGKYTQLENQRKSLEAQIKASHNRTVMKKLQQELVQVEAEIQSLNLHIALPGHKPVPTKTMTPIQQLEGEIAKAQENNLTAVQSVCNTMDSYQNNNGPAVEYQFGSKQAQQHFARMKAQSNAYQLAQLKQLLKLEQDVAAYFKKEEKRIAEMPHAD